MAAHQAPLFLGFSRQEHWSGLPFPSPMHESEKWKWSRSVVSDSSQPHGLQPTRLLRPWDFPGKSTGMGCQSLLQGIFLTEELNLSRRRQWQCTPVLLPGKSHGRRSLVSYSLWGCEESDTTERLHFHFSLSCLREGNGNLLQCSWLKNARDGGAWWTAVSGVVQTRTWLQQLSSSSR